jgi:acyl carrier protein
MLTAADVLAGLRAILAQVSGNEEEITGDRPLFGGGVGLDSLTGTLLLVEVKQHYGVDVAAEDLNLDSLETLDSLAVFITDQLAPPPAPAP